MSLINPITGEAVDLVLTEKEAKEQGYMEFEFILNYLEDENESVMFFIHGGKKVIVDRARPRYKQGTQINQDRVLADTLPVNGVRRAEPVSSAPSCQLGDEGCISCSG